MNEKKENIFFLKGIHKIFLKYKCLWVPFQNPNHGWAYKALKGRYEEVKPGRRDWLRVQRPCIDSRETPNRIQPPQAESANDASRWL